MTLGDNTKMPKPTPLPELEDAPHVHGSPHTHIDKHGFLVECYHSTRTGLASPGFWVGVTFSFPIEHFLWEKVWPFSALHTWMGL